MQTKNYLILFAALLLSAIEVHAQYNPYWKWAKADTANAMAVNDAGSILGVKSGGKALWGRMTAAKRAVPGGEQGNYFLGEYDSSGILRNATLITGNVQLMDVQADAAGNWYVLGKFYDSAAFTGVLLLRSPASPNPDADHFIVRYNSITLAPDWVKVVGPRADVSARAFTMDNTNIYVAADSINSTIIRTMSLATGASTSLFSQTGISKTTSIQLDAQGNIYLAGSCATDGISFNGVSEPATSPEPYSYIVKYRNNSAHTHAWHYWMHDRFCAPRKLTLYKNSFLYYTGSVRDSFDIGSVRIHHSSPGSSDYIAARLDTAGALIWTRQLAASTNSQVDFSEPYHAVVTPDTALVVFGQATGYMYWGDSLETNLQAVNAATLVAIGPNNRGRWVRPVYAQYTTSQHIATEGNAIWVSGNAYSLTGSTVLDTLHLNMPAMKYVPYLAKTNLIRPIPVINQQGIHGLSADEVAVYPLPAHTALQIEGLPGQCTLTLSDISGRAVRRLNTPAGTTHMTIDVADLPRGAYVLDMRSDGARVIRKVVLQ